MKVGASGASRMKSFMIPETHQIHRPLLYLLPIYMLGSVLGPELKPFVPWLWGMAGVLVVLTILYWFRRRRIVFHHVGMVFLIIGAAATAQVLTPPRLENHVYRFRDMEGLVFGGTILEMPRVSEGRTRLVVGADEMLTAGGEYRSVCGRIYVTVPGDRPAATAGHRVRFPAKLREIRGFGNPGGFDYQLFMNAQGLWVSTFLSSPSLMVVMGRPGKNKPTGSFLAEFRLRAAEYIDAYTMQPARGIFKALLLGVRDEVDPGITEIFRVFGLAHLLSISGLHVGLVALVSYWILYRLLLLKPNLALRYNVRHICAAVSAFPVLGYVALAGGRPSTSRAAVMVMVFLLSTIIDRKRDSLTALAAAAWFILILEPAALFLASFQLSFAAAGAILAAYNRFMRTDTSVDRHDEDIGQARILLHRLRRLSVIPLAATLGTAPIIAWHFHRLPVFSLPVNIVFTPLIGFGTIPGGLAALAIAPICPLASQGLFFLLERILWIFLLPLESMATRFGIEILVARPGFLFMAGYYALLGMVIYIKPGARMLRAAALTAAVWGGLMAVPWMYYQIRDPELRVTVLDVGQGSAAHISFPDHSHMILDGGGFPGSTFDPGPGLIQPYLSAGGITRLNLLALSHPQADHVIGLPYLAQNFSPAELWTNGAPGTHPAYELLKQIAKTSKMHRPSLSRLHQPRRFGQAVVQAFWPPVDYLENHCVQDILDHQNDFSLVLKISFGQIAFLFPGDLEKKGVTQMVRQFGNRLRADVLLAPHHGDADSMTPDLIEAVQPRFVVFSAGRFNRFNHPSLEADSLAVSAGARTLRTDRHGAVTFVTDGRRLTVHSFRR